MPQKNVIIEDFLIQQEIEFESLDMAEKKGVETRWLKVFAQNVKTQTGGWITNKFKWHGFSQHYEKAVEGPGAFAEYQDQWPAPYFVFDEDLICCYRCNSPTYPDFTDLNADIYVVHHNIKWTMVFTHEQPHDGPFFATRK